MEKILSIKEVHNVKLKNHWSNFDGYEVVTDKQTIQFLISNEQSCCESWGYLTSNDNVDDFIGTELKEITQTDTALNTKVRDMHEYGFDAGDCMFINLETTNGTLQLAVYNSHNGYYGHSVLFLSEQLKIDEGI